VAPNAATPVGFSASPMLSGIQSPASNPYTNGPPIPTLGGSASPAGGINTASGRPRQWQNGQTFQIISAGNDRLFGMGGQYVASGNVKLPWVQADASYAPDTLQTSQATNQAIGATLGGDARAREADNLTNFSQGKLD